MQSHFCFGCGDFKPAWGFPRNERFVGGIVPFHVGCKHSLASPGGKVWSVMYEQVGWSGRLFADRDLSIDIAPANLADVVSRVLEVGGKRIELVRHYVGAERAMPAEVAL
jgi:hypothetical protein